MKKKEHFTPDYTKHYVLQEIGMIKGYIMNQIHIGINLSSDTGHTFYEEIKDKFTPEALSSKYITNSNYLYSEAENGDLKTIEIRIMTNRHDPIDMKAKKKLLYKINKYT